MQCTWVLAVNEGGVKFHSWIPKRLMKVKPERTAIGQYIISEMKFAFYCNHIFHFLVL